MIKTEEEIALIKESSLIVSKTLEECAKHLKIGVTGLQIDKIACEFIRDHGAEPGFLGFHGFPNALCISPNEAVVHGIPTDIPYKEGDIVSLDCGVLKNGYYGDSAYTFALGEIPTETAQLLKVTYDSLFLAIDQAVVGKRVGDIGFVVQNLCEKQHGYGVVRDLVGHGLGQGLHEEPEVPNFGKRGRGVKLQEGMVICIEPMINMGTRHVGVLKDEWTIVTRDKKPSAHYEQTVVVRKGKAEQLTDYDIIEAAVKSNAELAEIK